MVSLGAGLSRIGGWRCRGGWSSGILGMSFAFMLLDIINLRTAHWASWHQSHPLSRVCQSGWL